MGVKKTVLREGDGETFPKKGQKLAMHYLGTMTDGTKFDSSYDRGQPFEFKIGKGEVIRGWDEGVMKMSLGEKAKLNISSDFAYGKDGIGPIPPNSDLVFVVELLKIGDKSANLPAEGGCCIIS